MPWPADNLQDDVDTVSAAHINAIVKSITKWEGDVNANGYALTSLSSLRVGAFTGGGHFSVDAPDVRLVFRRSNGAVNEKLWDISTTAGGLAIRAVNDAYTAPDIALWLHRVGDAVSRVEVHALLRLMPEAAAAGEGGNLELMDPTGTGSFMIDNYTNILRIFRGGSVYVTIDGNTGQIAVAGPLRRYGNPVHASNAAAIAAGLLGGTEYRTPDGHKMEVY